MPPTRSFVSTSILVTSRSTHEGTWTFTWTRLMARWTATHPSLHLTCPRLSVRHQSWSQCQLRVSRYQFLKHCKFSSFIFPFEYFQRWWEIDLVDILDQHSFEAFVQRDAGVEHKIAAFQNLIQIDVVIFFLQFVRFVRVDALLVE